MVAFHFKIVNHIIPKENSKLGIIFHPLVVYVFTSHCKSTCLFICNCRFPPLLHILRQIFDILREGSLCILYVFVGIVCE